MLIQRVFVEDRLVHQEELDLSNADRIGETAAQISNQANAHDQLWYIEIEDTNPGPGDPPFRRFGTDISMMIDPIPISDSDQLIEKTLRQSRRPKQKPHPYN